MAAVFSYFFLFFILFLFYRFDEVCQRVPGKKIFVQIVGSVGFLLQHWPSNSVLVITADELGNFGLGDGVKHWGPHGPGREFPSNSSSPHHHIVLPADINPWFKQYYNWKQVQGTRAHKKRGRKKEKKKEAGVATAWACGARILRGGDLVDALFDREIVLPDGLVFIISFYISFYFDRTRRLEAT